MLRWLMRKQLEKFGKAFDYDVGYMLDMAEVSPRAARLFGGIAKFAHYHRGAPKAALYAAGLTATLAEDCGPCTQLGVTITGR